MSTAENQMPMRLRDYLSRLRYLDLGYATVPEVARYLIDRLAFSGDIELFPSLRDSFSEPLRTEMLMYLTELASIGFTHYPSGLGVRAVSDEALLKDKERVRNNYVQLADLAGGG